MRIWLVIALAACGSSSSKPDALLVHDDAPIAIDARHVDAAVDARYTDAHVVIVDAPADTGTPGVCDVLAQTGCNTGEKCAWLHDSDTVGHIGCAPAGAVGIGGGCTYGAPGPTGYDDCMTGAGCIHGQCEAICDRNGGSPACDTSHACQVYEGLFGSPGGELAGVCDPMCDPLADNDFDGSGSALTKTGTTCGSDLGCYGYFNSTAPTQFTCAPEPAGSTMLFHRTACTSASGCASSTGTPYLNGCAQGYLPIVADDTSGSSTYVCAAMCKPADCYAGHCGTGNANAIGAAPHRCNAIDARGTFDTAADGDQCVYAWLFEEDFNATVVHSAYDDKVGLCIDHSRYHLADASGVTSMTAWPACSTLPLTATSTTCIGKTATAAEDLSGCTAVDFGCVSTTTGGVPARRIPSIRLPYHRIGR